MERLAGLSQQETAACVIAERSLGVTAEPWDIPGRSGAVDALLHFPDGRTAGFEVTELAQPGAQQTERLLDRDDNEWPSTGLWRWSISVGSPRDLPRLKRCYQRIILTCEAAKTPFPVRVAYGPGADVDARWLVAESSCSMLGHPEVPSDSPKAVVVPAGGGGAVDGALEGFTDGLREAFQQPHMARHFDKLKRAKVDERDLFIPLHSTALPIGVTLGLMIKRESLPPDAPPVPEWLTRLWLAPQFSRRVLLWTRGTGWRDFRPYN